MLSACSSLPRRMQAPEKKNADQNLALAQKYELRERYQDAKSMYANAHNQYLAFADIEGILQCYAGEARINLVQGEENEYLLLLQKMQTVIEDNAPEKAYHLILMDLQRYAKAGDWLEIKNRAQIQKNYPTQVKLQILSYLVQANAFTNSQSRSRVQELRKLYRKARKNLGAEYPAQLISQAAYSLAYHYFSVGDYSRAKSHLANAHRLDYAYSMFQALGYDYWLKGNIALKERDFQTAKTSFNRALLIFDQYQNPEIMAKIRQQLDFIPKGGKP